MAFEIEFFYCTTKKGMVGVKIRRFRADLRDGVPSPFGGSPNFINSEEKRHMSVHKCAIAL